MRLIGSFPYFCNDQFKSLPNSQPFWLVPLLTGMLLVQVQGWTPGSSGERAVEVQLLIPGRLLFTGYMQQNEQQILHKKGTNLPPPLHSGQDFSFLCAVAALP